MKWPGHLWVCLRGADDWRHVPAHVDCVCGAARSAVELDQGPVDRALRRGGSSFRATRAFHAAASLGAPGARHLAFDDLERDLGLSRMFRVHIDEPRRTREVLAELRALDAVERASVQTLAYAPLRLPSRPAAAAALTSAMWEPRLRVGADRALALEPGDPRVTVAVVDTGVSLRHPELAGRLLAGGFDTVDLGDGPLNEELELVGDSRERDATPDDETGHGSHVAGVIGARGLCIPPGLAGAASVLPMRVLAAARAMGDGGGQLLGVGALGDIDAGLKLAVDRGADVINMSFGTPADSVDPHAGRPHEEVVAYAAARGCVLVAAAGNSGSRADFYPAALPDVIAVGSMGADGRRSRFSTYGPHLALCAPGESVISTGVHLYRRSSGTSHAAPFVTGAAALLVARALRRGRRLSVEGVRRLLTESARQANGRRGFDVETGHGLLDAAGALRLLDEVLDAAGEDRREGSA